MLAVAVGHLHAARHASASGWRRASLLLLCRRAAVRARAAPRSGARPDADRRASTRATRSSSRSRRSRYYCAFFLIPLGFLLLFAVATPVGFGEVEYGFDLGNFSAALDPLYIEVFLRTLRTAAVGTLLIIARRLSARLLDRALRARAPPRPVPGADHRPVLDVVPDPDLLVPDRALARVLPVRLAAVARPHGRAARDPQHDDRDPDRARLQLPAAVRAAALRDARADGLAAGRRRDRPRREPVGGVPPDHAAADGAGPDHRHAARVHPDDGRVRDPARARRRPRRLHRQRHPAAVPRGAGLRARRPRSRCS